MLSNCILKQLSDGALTTKDGKEFHKLTTPSVKIFNNVILNYIFYNLYILPLVWETFSHSSVIKKTKFQLELETQI